MSWLRERGNYLAPGDGLNLWSLFAALLTGILVNLIVILPVFFCAFFLLTREVFICKIPEWFPFISNIDKTTSFHYMICAGIILAIVFVVFALVFAIFTARTCKDENDNDRGYKTQRKMRKWAGNLLLSTVALFLIGTIPYVAEAFKEIIKYLASAISLSGLISFLSGLIDRKDENETKGFRSLLLTVGLSLLVYGFFLLMYNFAFQIKEDELTKYWLIIAGSLLISVITALLADINHISMHRYYRNRLMEAYMPNENADKYSVKADCCKLHSIYETYPITDAPYHIINTNIQTIGSKKPKFKARGGNSFILSPYFCGSDPKCTGYIQTDQYVKGSMNLATAMAISGAAVDPNSYFTRSRPLAFVMDLLNLRLGYWIENPNPKKKISRFSRFNWYIGIFTELFGSNLDETNKYIHLSDGGHFENLGLYELIQRKCKTIIVSDAGADPDWQFSDLARGLRWSG